MNNCLLMDDFNSTVVVRSKVEAVYKLDELPPIVIDPIYNIKVVLGSGIVLKLKYTKVTLRDAEYDLLVSIINE